MIKNASLKLYYVTYSYFTFSKKFKSRILIQNNSLKMKNGQKWTQKWQFYRIMYFKSVLDPSGCLNIELGPIFQFYRKMPISFGVEKDEKCQFL